MKRAIQIIVVVVAVILMNDSWVCAMGDGARDMKPVTVDVLTIKGCKVTPPTIDQITAIAGAMKVPITINTIYVESKDEATEKKFYGSPTVRMDNLDIEPLMRGSKSYGIG